MSNSVDIIISSGETLTVVPQNIEYLVQNGNQYTIVFQDGTSKIVTNQAFESVKALDYSGGGGGGGTVDPRVDTVSGDLKSLSGQLYDEYEATYSSWTEEVTITSAKTDFELTSSDIELINQGIVASKLVEPTIQSFSGLDTAVIVYDGSEAWVNNMSCGPDITFTGSNPSRILLVNHRRSYEAEQYEIYFNGISTSSGPYFGGDNGSYQYDWYAFSDEANKYTRFAEGTLSSEEVEQLPTTTITSSVTHTVKVKDGFTGDVRTLSSDTEAISGTVNGYTEVTFTSQTVNIYNEEDYSLVGAPIEDAVADATDQGIAGWNFSGTTGKNLVIHSMGVNDGGSLRTYLYFRPNATAGDEYIVASQSTDVTAVTVFDPVSIGVNSTLETGCYLKIRFNGYDTFPYYSVVETGLVSDLGWTVKSSETFTGTVETYHSGITDQLSAMNSTLQSVQTTANEANSRSYSNESNINTLSASTSASSTDIAELSGKVGSDSGSITSDAAITFTSGNPEYIMVIDEEDVQKSDFSGWSYELKMSVGFNEEYTSNECIFGYDGDDFRMFINSKNVYFDVAGDMYRMMFQLPDGWTSTSWIFKFGYKSTYQEGLWADVYVLEGTNASGETFSASPMYASSVPWSEGELDDDLYIGDRKARLEYFYPWTVNYLKIYDKEGSLIHDYEPMDGGVKDAVDSSEHQAANPAITEYTEGGTRPIEATGLYKKIYEGGGSSMVYDSATGTLSGAKDTEGNPVELALGTVTITF